ncbi:MAG: hypothetical protein ACI3VU_02970 [Faecousia sp.]
MKKRYVLLLCLCLVVVAAVICICVFYNAEQRQEKQTASSTQASSAPNAEEPSRLPTDNTKNEEQTEIDGSVPQNEEQTEIDGSVPQNEERIEIDGFVPQEAWTPVTDRGLEISAAGSYSGKYMEDGTDDPIENVSALLVRNIGTETVEYAEVIGRNSGGETLRFVLTGLPVNASVLVLEADRCGYSEISAPQVTEYAAALDVTEDYAADFEIYPGDGVINIRNVSGEELTDDIYVYYKNYRDGVFLGGITYRARFDGLRDQAIGQSIQSHATGDETVVVYMTYEK